MNVLKLMIGFVVLFLISCGNGNSNDKTIDNVTLSADSLKLDYSASKQSLQIHATDQWSVSSDQAWCVCSMAGGIQGSYSLDVTIAENGGESARIAWLTFKCGTFEKKVKVSQTASPAYRLVWSDEFDSSKPSLPSSDSWTYETGGGGWGNNELENYVAGKIGSDTLAYVSNGTLKIYARKIDNTVYSIRMNTSKSWTYGYFEARLKLPKGKGTWPAFWMMPKNFSSWPGDGEIDIMEEVGFNPNYVSSSIHCTAYNHTKGTQKTAAKFVDNAEGSFHVYALEWTANYIKGYVDGANYFTFNNDGQGNKDTWPFNAAFYLKLNLAWGGNWGGANGVDESALPLTYEIDYVRVYQK